jgi:hypothetical protein
MSELHKEEFVSPEKQIENQFRATAEAVWGHDWEMDVDKNAVFGLTEELKRADRGQGTLLKELIKSIEFRDLEYFFAIYCLICEDEVDETESRYLIAEIKHAEKLPLPKLKEVTEYIVSVLSENEIKPKPFLAKLPAVSSTYENFLGAFESGEYADDEIAQQMLDLVNGLKRALKTGKVGIFFNEHPEFWHYLSIALKKTGVSINTL